MRPILRTIGGHSSYRFCVRDVAGKKPRYGKKPDLARERSEADAVVLDHSKLTGPVGTACEGGNRGSNGMIWRGEGNPEEHDSNRCCQAAAKCQLAEVLVVRHKHAAVALRAFQDLGIRAAGSILVNPRDVVASLSKAGDDGTGNVLVSEQPGGHVHREMRG